jgi:flagellar basal-body rod protein FlgF
MDTTTYIALSRQTALARRMTVVAQNLANVNTPGYKAERIRFETVWEPAGPPGRLAFVQEVGRLRDMTDGPLAPTGNPLDFAISGDGFFTVATPDGPAYARSGRFRLDPEGTIVTSTGQPLLDENGSPVTVPAGSSRVELASDGTLSVESGPFARLQIVTFADPARLERIGDGLFRTDQSPQPSADARLVQGMLEGSNVQPVAELTRLIDTTRAFEMVQRLIETHHELDRRVIQQATTTS